MLIAFFIFFFWPHRTTCGILIPQTRNQTCAPCIGKQIFNCWTTGEVPIISDIHFLLLTNLLGNCVNSLISKAALSQQLRLPTLKSHSSSISMQAYLW